MIKILGYIRKINIEAWIWIAGLTVLAILNPDSHSHFTLCPFKNLGFRYCPGCGLGHSISYLFHGNIKESIQAHILGIPAVIILLIRTISIIKKTSTFYSSITTTKG
ncbi:MAG: DUF2752 domain-containing protein [Ignavibacteriaceae bacterium]|nr:DUF2752 domain-containing protein [Ignavibacteriaceae bacterium]